MVLWLKQGTANQIWILLWAPTQACHVSPKPWKLSFPWGITLTGDPWSGTKNTGWRNIIKIKGGFPSCNFLCETQFWSPHVHKTLKWKFCLNKDCVTELSGSRENIKSPILQIHMRLKQETSSIDLVGLTYLKLSTCISVFAGSGIYFVRSFNLTPIFLPLCKTTLRTNMKASYESHNTLHVSKLTSL